MRSLRVGHALWIQTAGSFSSPSDEEPPFRDPLLRRSELRRSERLRWTELALAIRR